MTKKVELYFTDRCTLVILDKECIYLLWKTSLSCWLSTIDLCSSFSPEQKRMQSSYSALQCGPIT